MEAKVPPKQLIRKRARTEDTPDDAEYAYTGPKRVRHWKPHEDREVTPLNLQPAKSQLAVADNNAAECKFQSARSVQDTRNLKNAPKVQDAPEVKGLFKAQDVHTKVDNEHETRVRSRNRTRSQSFVDSDETLSPISKRTRIESAVLVSSVPGNTPVSNLIRLVLFLDNSALSY